MQPNSERWHVVTESEFDHEREGLTYLQQLLPDRAPFHAWSNFEFRSSDGPWSEVDLLVLLVVRRREGHIGKPVEGDHAIGLGVGDGL